MKTNKMLWLSIAAAALLVTGNAFAADTAAPASAGAAVADTAKHHGQRHHRGMHHAGMKPVDTTAKKTA